MYECETWSLTLKKEHRLREFENRVLRRIFGPKRDEVTGWRKLNNEEHDSPNVIRVIALRGVRWAVYAERMGSINVYNILVGKLEKKREL
jgi:hypothetical protein